MGVRKRCWKGCHGVVTYRLASRDVTLNKGCHGLSKSCWKGCHGTAEYVNLIVVRVS